MRNFAKYIFFFENKPNYSFLDRDQSDVMISGSVLSSSEVAQCSCNA